MNVMNFLNYLISGISLGSIYAIIALGYTMVYGIAKMLNFAHGDVIMVGAYICFFVMSGLSSAALPPFAAPIVGTLAAMAVCTVLGVVIERLAYKPLRQATSLAVLITAIGVSYFLQNAAQLLWTSSPKYFTSVVGNAQLTLFDGRLTISAVTLLTIVVCIIIMLALTTFTNKTKMGKAMRACSEDKGAAQLMGIDVNRTISVTFAIGSALAAVAGVLFMSAYPSLTPTTGLHAGHQGLHRRRVRRHRLHSRSAAGRPSAGHHRDLCPGLYLHRAVHGHRVRRADCGAAGQARRPAGQDGARESVRWER